jgi:hypothetical protein
LSHKELINKRVIFIAILRLYIHLIICYLVDKKSDINVPSSIENLCYNLSVNKFYPRLAIMLHVSNPSYAGGRVRRIMVQGWPGKK